MPCHQCVHLHLGVPHFCLVTHAAPPLLLACQVCDFNLSRAQDTSSQQASTLFITNPRCGSWAG